MCIGAVQATARSSLVTSTRSHKREFALMPHKDRHLAHTMPIATGKTLKSFMAPVRTSAPRDRLLLERLSE